MSGLRERLRHPFWQAVGLVVLSYLIFKFGIAYLPPLIGMKSAPVPQSVVLQFLAIAMVGVLLFVSSDEARWARFQEPIGAALRDADKRWIRVAMLVIVPLLVAFGTYQQVKPTVSAPIQLRSIHPAPPTDITFRGKKLTLATLENPLRTRGSMEEHLVTGKRVYYQNCLACHGDLLDGRGHFGHGFSPTPLSFLDNGTIAQLTESFVFWRVAKGGPGLPKEGAPWNSAMPVWEDFLTEDEIWAVILYIYQQSGWQPRRWETHEPAAQHGSATQRPNPAHAVPRQIASSGGFLLTAGMLPGLETVAQAPHAGKPVYDKWCAGCHGDNGAGDGAAAAFMLPRPRDFTKGVYQVRTTASGELPSDDDIRRVVDEGMPGTAMPGWSTLLSEQERSDVVGYLKTFSQFFTAAAPATVAFGSAPSMGDGALDEGRQAYLKLECFKCHGDAGRGDGTSAASQKDDAGQPIRVADLTENWHFNGGGTVEEIFRRLRTGLDGTPMPSFSDAMDAGVVTEEQLWRVAQYVRSLSPAEEPVVDEVIPASLATGPFPAGPADSLWNGVDKSYVPLVGQIIQKPRWFLPTVDGVWVQAMHDGTKLALRLTWHDPSRSPDPSWDEWLGRINQTAMTADGAVPATQGPDRFAVQFPKRITDEAEQPFFLGGDNRNSVQQVLWNSASDSVIQGTKTSSSQFTASAGAEWTHASRFDNGEWQLQLVRPLLPADTAASPSFRPGQAIPIAFVAGDGSNGEIGLRGSVSAWYNVFLEVPTPMKVYVQAVLAGLLTAVLGMVLVFNAQRRDVRA